MIIISGKPVHQYYHYINSLEIDYWLSSYNEALYKNDEKYKYECEKRLKELVIENEYLERYI